MIQSPSASATLEDDDMPTRPSGSRKKLYECGYRDETDTTNKERFDVIGRGYQLIDLESLAFVVAEIFWHQNQTPQGMVSKMHVFLERRYGIQCHLP